MRNALTKTTLAASLAAALAFIFSCSDGSDGGSEPSSSSGTVTEVSSSSVVSSSSAISSSSNNSYSLSSSSDGSSSSNSYEDKGNNISNYKIVIIGEQTWMAENLNYAVEGSKCYGEDGLVYDSESKGYNIALSNVEIQANCDKYGRLYDWSTAMALPSSCNSASCASQVNSPHQGICPDGWHIPSNEDWNKLIRYVDGTSGASGSYDSPVAGRYLKAASGWDDFNGVSGGEDTHEFSALPGGMGASGGSFGFFHRVGKDGVWQSASEYNSALVHVRDMSYIEEHVYCSENEKRGSFSVRCVKD